MERDKPVLNNSEYVNTFRATLIIYFSGCYMMSVYPTVNTLKILNFAGTKFREKPIEIRATAALAGNDPFLAKKHHTK